MGSSATLKKFALLPWLLFAAFPASDSVPTTSPTAPFTSSLFFAHGGTHPSLLGALFRRVDITSYLAWVAEECQGTPALFGAPWAEHFSRTPPFAVLLWVPVSLYLAAGALALPLASSLLLLVAGALTWSILEYLLHRFLFHLDKSLPPYALAMVLAFMLHGVHHKYPKDATRIVLPARKRATITPPHTQDCTHTTPLTVFTRSPSYLPW